MHAHAFSESAEEKIAAAGGSTTAPLIAGPPLPAPSLAAGGAGGVASQPALHHRRAGLRLANLTRRTRGGPVLTRSPGVPDARPPAEAPVHAGDHRRLPAGRQRARARASPSWRSTAASTRPTPRPARLYALVNLFSGGALLQLSVFALGIMPYITATIIVQLLVVVIPRFEQLKKEGQSGQAKLTQYTRYLTIALAVLQSHRHHRAGPLRPAVPRAATQDIIPSDSLWTHGRPGRHADRRHRRDHVAGRAAHRKRRRQRHVRADLHLDHRAIPAQGGASCRADGGFVFAADLRAGPGGHRARWSTSSRPSGASPCSTPSA